MKEEIWAAIDKIEDEYLIDDNYVSLSCYIA